MLYQTHDWVVPKIWIRGIVLLVIILLLDIMGVMGWFRMSVKWVATPVVMGITIGQKKIAGITNHWSQLNNVAARNLDLERQIAENQLAINQLQELQEENAKLRQILELNPKAARPKVIGKVVSSSFNKYRIWTEEGVVVGSGVMYQDRIIGVVSQVQGLVAEVDALGYMKGKIMAKIWVDGKNVTGELALNGTELGIENLVKSANIVTGAAVTTVGDSMGIAPDIAIGIIAETNTAPEAIYQNLKLKTYPKVEVGEMVWTLREEK